MPTCPAGHTSASGDFCDVCGARIGGTASTPAAPPHAPPQQPRPQEPRRRQPQPQEPGEPCPQCGTARSGRFCESCGFDFDARGAPGATAAARAVRGGDGDGAAAAAAGQPGSGPPASGGSAAAPGERAPAPGGPTAARGRHAAAPGEAAPAPGGPAPQTWTAVVAGDRAYFEEVIAAGGPDAPALTFPAYCPERRFRLTGPEMRIGRRSVSQGLEPEIDLTGPPTDPGVSRMHAVLIAEPDGSWVILDPGSENGTFVNGTEIAAGERRPLRDGDRIHIGAWTLITVRAG